MFVDEAFIEVSSGNGGNGCLSFRREKYIPKGGPDGGDGGRGGSVYFSATEGVTTLVGFSGRHHWHAANGRDGSGGNRHGANGEDLVIDVPAGTLIFDTDLGLLLKDLSCPGEKICVCRGGRGGMGNKHFASPTDQAPRRTTSGAKGRKRNIRLELKLLADVGLVGLPNAGKSTLISRCSAARPKIADYPFTTVEPVLGIAELAGFRRFVMADIPGLIEGAHRGAGLGFEFLRHIERTRIIVHLLDIMPLDGSEPSENYRVIRDELARYSPLLAAKPEVIVASKADLDPGGEAFARLGARIGKPLTAVSAVTGSGVAELQEIIWRTLSERSGK